MTDSAAPTLNQELIDSVVARLAEDRPIREVLPADGLLNIDRRLPFLLVYRPPPGESSPLFSTILTGGASYLLAPTSTKARSATKQLVAAIAKELSAAFGAFLIVELWPSAAVDPDSSAAAVAKPEFTLYCGVADQTSTTVEKLATSLERISIMKRRAVVVRVPGSKISRPGMPQLLSQKLRDEIDVTLLGIEVAPVYIDPETGDVLPLVARTLARLMARTLQQGAFEFAQAETNDRSMHYHALGRRTFVAAARTVDQQLTTVAESFDLLMSVTPVNSEAAFRAFRRMKFERAPRLHYRPMAVDPDLLKRKLWNIKIERVEDPVLDQLFREKRRELDLKLTLLSDRERGRFVHTSLALYGPVKDELQRSARNILDEVHAPRQRQEAPERERR